MISQTGVHAVRAMIVLGSLDPGARGGAAAIADRVRAPRNYLGKLLNQLGQHGLVASRQGVGGGFELARPAASISLYDILEPVEDVSRFEGCFLGKDDCSSTTPCHVHSRWGPVRDAYLAFLKDTTLRELTLGGGVDLLERFLDVDSKGEKSS